MFSTKPPQKVKLFAGGSTATKSLCSPKPPESIGFGGKSWPELRISETTGNELGVEDPVKLDSPMTCSGDLVTPCSEQMVGHRRGAGRGWGQSLCPSA